MKIIRPMNINNPALLSSNVPEADYAAFNPVTTYAQGDCVIDINPASTVTISVATPAVVSWTAHGLPSETPVVFTTTGGLPTGITAGVAYYVLADTADTFKLAAAPNGAPINTSGSPSGTHTATASIHKAYESLQAGNIGKTPRSSPSWWLDLGNTNRWKMFDGSVTSQTQNHDSIEISIKSVGRMDSVALLNVSAATARFKMTDATEGVVYDQTHNLTSDSGITDWYAYFFESIVRVVDYVELDMPPYANAQLDITLADAGNTVLVGTCVVGSRKEIGGTEYGMRLGIQDYSIKQKDSFGNYSILERAFSKHSSLSVWVDNSMVDMIHTLLAGFRATAIVYIGSDRFGSSVIYGFYKDFYTVIAYPNQSLCDIELEGLT